MSSITIFGTGNMGTALGEMLTSGGASVRHVTGSEAATVTDDIVILAVPYEALADIARQYRDQFEQRIVVDITNPVDFETFDALKVPADSSATAKLQAALPEARVVKAFNINFAQTLSSKRVGPNTTTVLVAGESADAKRTVIDLVKGCGLDALDAGALARARELEAMGFLQITLANAEKIGWSAGFGLVA